MKKLKKILKQKPDIKRIAVLSIVFFMWLCALDAQVIPPSRCSEWNRAGCDFSFPEPDTTLFTGAVGDGVTNDQPAIQSTINTLDGKYKVVFIPPGTYLLSSSLSLPDSIILRGAESNSTFLKFNHSSSGIVIGGSSAGSLTDIVSGLERGSQKISVANSALFVSGNYAEIREDNGSWDSNPATWASYCVGQIVRIDSVIGDTLFLQDPLRIDYDTILHPQIRTFIPRRTVSIECMSVERTDTSTAGTGYNFNFNFAVNCRIKGVESNKSQGSHCMIGASSQITVSGCYFHDAYKYDGSGTKGYGLTIINHAGLCLIVNNIFKHVRHSMMVKQGANGNVFAYNYSREPFRNGQYEIPADYGGDISLHGHYSFANLFEGNIVQNIYIDQTWGPSGPYNTFFRNRAELYGFIMTSAQTLNQNIVGNEITGVGYTFPFNHGAYTITGTGHLQHGNNDNGTIVPSGTNVLNDNSYFITAQPSFWNITSVWPSIGAPNSPSSGDIPAHVRYFAGQYTDCNDITTTTENVTQNTSDLKVFPNPFKDGIHIQTGEIEGDILVRLYDIMGRLIQSQQFDNVLENDILSFPIRSEFERGMYFLGIENKTRTKSIILIKE